MTPIKDCCFELITITRDITRDVTEADYCVRKLIQATYLLGVEVNRVGVQLCKNLCYIITRALEYCQEILFLIEYLCRENYITKEEHRKIYCCCLKIKDMLLLERAIIIKKL